MKYYTLLSSDDCNPPHGLNMNPGSSDSIKVDYLVNSFLSQDGFGQFPALIGYPLNGKIQLLSGTHRHMAAKITKTLLPVSIFLRSYIEAYWGTDKWSNIMEDIPVDKLDYFEQEYLSVSDSPPGLDERRMDLYNQYT